MNEQFSAEAIEQALGFQRLVKRVLYFPSVGSTNDVAAAEAVAGAGEGLLVVADEQTRGRGREGRSWWAPAGTSLLMSLLLRPSLPASEAGQLTMCLGLGACEGIEEVTGLRPALKWPNDLLLDGRKLGGMLAEVRTTAGRLDFAVLGLGVNVNTDFRGPDVPDEVREIATSIADVAGGPAPRLPLLAAIAGGCGRRYAAALQGQSPHEEWAGRLDTLGRTIEVRVSTGTALRGVAVGVTPQGALLLQLPGGEVHTVWAGDVAPI